MSKKTKNDRSGAVLPSGTCKIGILSASAVAEIALYLISIKLEIALLYVLLYVFTALLAVSAFALSGAGAKEIPKKSDLRDDLDDKFKDRLIAFLTKGREISKILMLILLPLLFILGFDIVKVMFF